MRSVRDMTPSTSWRVGADMRFTAYSGPTFVCSRCQAVVADTTTHMAWHEDLDLTAERAEWCHEQRMDRLT